MCRYCHTTTKEMSSLASLVLHQRECGDIYPALGIGCRPTWNSCVQLLHSRAKWRVFCFMLFTLLLLLLFTGIIIQGRVQPTYLMNGVHWCACRAADCRAVSCRRRLISHGHSSWASWIHTMIDASSAICVLQSTQSYAKMELQLPSCVTAGRKIENSVMKPKKMHS